MNKKGFTLVEILVVIVMVGLLIVAFRSFFSSDKKYEIKSQTCANNVYGKIRNYMDNAITGRSLILGANNTKNPEYYKIKFNTTDNRIIYQYSGADAGSGVYDTMKLKGDTYGWDTKYMCYDSNHYFVNLTGDNITLTMSKQLQGDITTQPPFLINDDPTIFTGQVQMEFCQPYDNPPYQCKDIAKLLIDRRVQQIRFIQCHRWDQDGKCKKRSSG